MTTAPPSIDLERSVLEGLNVGIFTVDADYAVLSWNRFMETNSTVPKERVLRQNLFEVFPDLPRAWLERKIRNVFLLANYGFSSWRQRPFLFPFPHNRPITGGVTHMQQDCTLMPVLDAAGVVRAVCITLIDATDACILQQETERTSALLRAAMSEVERLNDRDALTGIHNRRSLDKRLADELSRFARYQAPFSVLMFDLDHFKRVNDTFGHLGGDEVLRVVASRIEKSIRGTDTFGRYGGEEFMILLPSTNRSQALVVAEHIRALVCAEPVRFNDKSIAVTVSIGVTEGSNEATSPFDLIRDADAALYACKAAGRNCVRVHGLPELPALHLITGGAAAPTHPPISAGASRRRGMLAVSNGLSMAPSRASMVPARMLVAPTRVSTAPGR